MTITLTLSPELEQYLIKEANQHGLSVETVASELLTNSLLARQKQAAALDMLQSWIDDDDINEQQETGQYLIQALDQDRWSNRKLFPPEGLK
ncbi:hypothetical protein [Nodosilinea sp. P-1105]|uniref:hypothetical protein n=1 Tax=Nodosilinea sp. P-1105 TaxID=2546229 RepID=UPI00146CCC1E|nr:hypothetical protein [Nodosilinea sp. P-1105]NMF86675.1 hypothetical protein [Nodosilinea sp. P-1105]